MFDVLDTRRSTMAMASLGLATLMTAMDSSLINTSLTELSEAFGVPFGAGRWIVLAYLLPLTSLSVVAGRVGDAFGRSRVLVGAVALFAVTSATCAVAPTFDWLLAFRAIQGASAAAMLALGYAVIGDIPQRRPERAVGHLAAASAVGTTLGPIVGGVVAHYSARAVFLVNLPLAVTACGLALHYLPHCARRSSRDLSFDGVGAGVLTLTLLAYALVTSRPGGSPTLSQWLLVFTGVGALAFVAIEGRVYAPLVPLAMFRDVTFGVGLLASAVVATVLTSTLIVGPVYLTRAVGLGRTHVGLALAAGPAAAGLTAWRGGRIVERIGASRATGLGLLMMATGAGLIALLPYSAGIVGYVGPLMLVTSGYAMFQTANNASVLARPGSNHRGVAGGLLTLSRNVGQVTGASMMSAVFLHAAHANTVALASADAVGSGMRATMVVASILLLVVLAVVSITRSNARVASASVNPPRQPLAESNSPC